MGKEEKPRGTFWEALQAVDDETLKELSRTELISVPMLWVDDPALELGGPPRGYWARRSNDYVEISDLSRTALKTRALWIWVPTREVPGGYSMGQTTRNIVGVASRYHGYIATIHIDRFQLPARDADIVGSVRLESVRLRHTQGDVWSGMFNDVRTTNAIAREALDAELQKLYERKTSGAKTIAKVQGKLEMI